MAGYHVKKADLLTVIFNFEKNHSERHRFLIFVVGRPYNLVYLQQLYQL